MYRWQDERLTDAELRALFDRLFPHGLAGADVLAEVAPAGWKASPLLACFHPSIERVFDERLRMHRHIEALRAARHQSVVEPDHASLAEPYLRMTAISLAITCDLSIIIRVCLSLISKPLRNAPVDA